MFLILTHVWCSHSWKLKSVSKAVFWFVFVLCLSLNIFISCCPKFTFWFFSSWAWASVVTFKSGFLNVQSVIFIETIIQTWAGREDVLFEANVSWWDADHASDCTVMSSPDTDTCTHVSWSPDTDTCTHVSWSLLLNHSFFLAENYSGRIVL